MGRGNGGRRGGGRGFFNFNSIGGRSGGRGFFNFGNFNGRGGIGIVTIIVILILIWILSRA